MKGILLQNIAITGFSRLLGFGLSLYVARTIPEADYGHYVFVLLVVTMLPIAQFGAVQGITIELPKRMQVGANWTELYASFAFLSQSLQIVSVAALFILDSASIGWIGLVSLAVHIALSRVYENGKILFGAKLEFYGQLRIRWIDEAFRPLVQGILFFLYPRLDSVFLGQALVTVLLSLLVYLTDRSVVQHRPGRDFVNDIKRLYSIGFYIFLVWGLDVLFRSSDRWFVKVFYSVEDLAAYGFAASLAFNIWGVALAYLAPYAQLLYRSIAKEDWTEARRVIRKANRELYALMVMMIVTAVALYPFVLKYIVKRYDGTWLLFSALAVGSFFLAANNMQIYYLSATYQHLRMLKYQLILVGASGVLYSVASIFSLPLLVLSILTLLALLVYWAVITLFVAADIKGRGAAAQN